MNELTPRQQTQIEWLRKMEANEELGSGSQYHFLCRTCKFTIWAYAADTIKMWIRKHAGHNTWLDYVR